MPADHPAWQRGIRWLVDKEIRTPGDWQIRRAGVEPTGWHFQFRNAFYPDLDDSAMVVLALNRSPLAGDPAVQAATRRGVNWLLSMQNRDGGWAAYDVDIDNQVLTQLPFADHNAMLDPSCADITARVVELLGTLGYRADHPSVARALDYLWSTQEPEGCWYGRWGVNYIYGTWQVLQGLKAIDFPMDHPALVKAADWLESVQQASGAWGETCQSYDDPALKGTGKPTPSQTAWATLALVAAGRACSPAVRSGIDYLIQTQLPDGSWDEPEFTGTGFPKVFYLRYHLYAVYFPLMAIARYQAAVDGRPVASSPALACQVPTNPCHWNFNKVDERRGLQDGKVGIAHRSSPSIYDGNPLCDPGTPRRPQPMLFPLPMTSRIAGYVARKTTDESQEISDGSHARTIARLQPDVHRLRANSRI